MKQTRSPSAFFVCLYREGHASIFDTSFSSFFHTHFILRSNVIYSRCIRRAKNKKTCLSFWGNKKTDESCTNELYAGLILDWAFLPFIVCVSEKQRLWRDCVLRYNLFRGGSRISGEVVHMYKGAGVRFADFISFFSHWNQIISFS